MEHTTWFDTHVADSVRNAAKQIGIPQRTLAAQLERQRLSPENIIKLAEPYGFHPVGALVDTGYLEAHWATHIDPLTALREVTEEQLAHEVLRRMKLGVATDALVTPIDEFPHLHAVADSSPDEDALRAQQDGDYD